jgi:uncharacterized protein YegL
MRSFLGLVMLSTAVLVPTSARADLDLAFLLDTTGSMSGEIREAKERVRQLAAGLSEARPNERIRIGVVAFRDRGDAYVTKVSPLSESVDDSFTFLATLHAGGGGDGPEDVLSGLRAAIRELEWSEGERQVFLIGDAPPHLDYQDGASAEELIDMAREKRIVVNTIGCRSLPSTGVEFFRRLAYQTEGRYQHIGRVQTGNERGLSNVMLEALTTNDLDSERRSAQPLAVHAEPPTSLSERQQLGLRVAYAKASAASTSDSCVISAFLPSRVRLAGMPDVRKGRRELFIDLALQAGTGGEHLRFLVRDCTHEKLPIRLSMGGLR